MQLDENDLLACRYSCLLVLGLFSGLATATSSSSSSLPAVSHGFLCFPSHTLPGCSALPLPFSHFFPASQLSVVSQFRERLPSRRPRVRLESRVARNLLAWKAVQFRNQLFFELFSILTSSLVKDTVEDLTPRNICQPGASFAAIVAGDSRFGVDAGVFPRGTGVGVDAVAALVVEGCWPRW